MWVWYAKITPTIISECCEQGGNPRRSHQKAQSTLRAVWLWAGSPGGYKKTGRRKPRKKASKPHFSMASVSGTCHYSSEWWVTNYLIKLSLSFPSWTPTKSLTKSSQISFISMICLKNAGLSLSIQYSFSKHPLQDAPEGCWELHVGIVKEPIPSVLWYRV